MNKPTVISQRILQARCQSRTSQSTNQSFVKELSKSTWNQLTTNTKEEHRTDNSPYTHAGVSCFIRQESGKFKVQFFVESSVLKVPHCVWLHKR